MAANLKIKLFADTADLKEMARLCANPLVSGFTTNPSLMRKAGASDYAAYAREVLGVIGDRPVSFEVFSDEFDEMEVQAMKIAQWGAGNVYVKIPVSNTRGESALPLIARLARRGVALNVTAIMTYHQAKGVSEALQDHAPSYVSVFAGRVADTGVDPLPMVVKTVETCAAFPKQEVLWASTREVFNLFQAQAAGCQVITVGPDVIDKLKGLGKDLDELSLDAVKAFRTDALAAGFTL